ncbi:MAG: aminotransferase class V-fold PLP-dependent enzyme [Clostridia bacterium]|nr:aminotransferase class V-fold PLP-dependent enzyme [Clostridia bacterium]
METLFYRLKHNKKLPMHMPGHKRNARKFPYLKGFADIDITEIDGFDNLHAPRGILKESMDRAARFRGADRAFYLVNGATCGILAVICAVLKKGDKVIVARNCHKAVYNAIELVGAEPIFVYPKSDNEYGIFGSVEPSEIAKKIEETPNIKLVIVTSPTYEGVISDIEKISGIAHKKGIPVMVDAAHGAHFGYGSFPKNAGRFGADASVESLHKTLPSLTQTAVCYITGNLIDANTVSDKLSVFESSSPSYILLSSIDGCIKALNTREKEIFGEWEKNLDRFFKDISRLKDIGILTNKNGKFFDLDKSKIVLFPRHKNGAALGNCLQKCGIEPEMTAPRYVILMTGAGEKKKSLKKLKKALKKIDKGRVKADNVPCNMSANQEFSFENGELCKIGEAVGRRSAGYLWAYPPEAPLLVPCEEISAETAKIIEEYQKSGLALVGSIYGDKIVVIK